jgi:hypothetical protein
VGLLVLSRCRRRASRSWRHGGRAIASRTSPSSTALADGEVALPSRFDSISSAALAAHDHAELTGALRFGSPDGVSAAADRRWTIRLDRVGHVGGRQRSAPSPATSTWPTRLPAYRAVRLVPAGPDPTAVLSTCLPVYLSTCLRHQSHGGAPWILAELQVIPRKRVLHTKQADLAMPGSRNSLFLGVFHHRRRQP